MLLRTNQFGQAFFPYRAHPALGECVQIRALGRKGLLYMLDGLYSAEESELNVVRFLSFGDHWMSSIFMSQDPVAIDSVGLDFLRSEPRARQVNGGNPDNFVHEAELVRNPPSGTK